MANFDFCSHILYHQGELFDEQFSLLYHSTILSHIIVRQIITYHIHTYIHT